MNQPSLNPPRRPGRWMRLALLIAGVGALSLIGAALGHGLGVFISGGAEAQAVGTPTLVPLLPTPGAASGAAPPINAQPPATTLPAPAAQAHSSPNAASPSPAPPASTRPAQQPAGGVSQPAQLPRTGGDATGSVMALALVLFVIGVALWVTPRAGFGRRDEKE